MFISNTNNIIRNCDWTKKKIEFHNNNSIKMAKVYPDNNLIKNMENMKINCY